MEFKRLTGRCRNGYERDKGTLIHAVEQGQALCGAIPGTRSSGWSIQTFDQPTCKRCASHWVKRDLAAKERSRIDVFQGKKMTVINAAIQDATEFSKQGKNDTEIFELLNPEIPVQFRKSIIKRVRKSCSFKSKMTPKDFIKAALRPEAVDMTRVQKRLQKLGNIRLLHSMIGLCTETGEIQDIMKKHIFYGKEIDRVNFVEELGDLMWYVAIACDELGVSLEEVMQKNAEKLAKRYEGGFTETKALNRDLGSERKILEKYAPKGD